MLKIRLLRIGKKHDPSFRVVLTDSRKAPQTGAFLEILGNYNAQKGEPQLKGDRIKYWISKGAQVSDTVHNLLLKLKIIEGEKKDVLRHNKIRKQKEKEAAEKKPAESATVGEEPKAEKEAGDASEVKEEIKEETKKEETEKHKEARVEEAKTEPVEPSKDGTENKPEEDGEK